MITNEKIAMIHSYLFSELIATQNVVEQSYNFRINLETKEFKKVAITKAIKLA
jgi:hypothetical protein